jgi:hypothetical protein
MSGFNEYYDGHLAGARTTAKLARTVAGSMEIELDRIRWQRGHEMADIDSRSLVLECGRRSICRTSPNEWLASVAKTGRDPRIESTVRDMLTHLRAEAVAAS